MLMTWAEFVAFVNSGLQELVETEFAQVRYGDVGMAFLLTVVVSLVLGVTLLRLLVQRRKHTRFHSGHEIDPSHQKRWWVRVVHTAPKALIAGALALILFAAADPFLTATEQVRGYIESRVRVDLVDTSGSMAWEFPNTGKSKAEVARDAHLRFLEMRREKNDRVSLWLFSTYPYMVDDFVVDDELYYFQVWDAPYVTAQRLDKAMVVPRDKVRIIPAEGDTNIIRPLRSIMKHFDRDEASMGGGKNLNRAILIITDAAVDEFPDAEFAALNQRNIVPYIIYINTSDVRSAMIRHPEGHPAVDRDDSGVRRRLLRRDRPGWPDSRVSGYRRARGGAGRDEASRTQGADLLAVPVAGDGDAGGRDPHGVRRGVAVGHQSVGITICDLQISSTGNTRSDTCSASSLP